MTSKMPKTTSTLHNSDERSDIVEEIENTLEALKRARRRKNELRSLLEVLQKQYKLVKTEIGLYEERIEKWMSDREYAALMDTTDLDTTLVFPTPSDQKSADGK